MKYVGIGSRVLNYIVDTLLVTIITYIVYHISSFHMYYYHTDGWPFYYFFWLVMVSYYFLFELIFSRTPGKWLSMTKVVNANGKRPAIWQTFLRSILRLTLVFDFLPIPFTDNDKTLHDYVTKTAVVEA